MEEADEWRAMEAMPKLIEESTNVKIGKFLRDLAALTFEIKEPWSWVEEVTEVGTVKSGFGNWDPLLQEIINSLKQREVFSCRTIIQVGSDE